MKRRNEMKKLMAMILTLAMVMSLCVVPASAADGKVTITITPDKESVDTTTGDAVVTYTVKAKVTDTNLKVGALTITLDPSAGLELAAKSKDDEPAFFYEENQSLYYHKKYSPSGIFETVFSYAPLTKTFVATGATLDRNLNSTHGEVVLMTIMGKIAKGTTDSVTLGTTTCTYSDVMAEASHNCDVTPATVTITSATSNELPVAITKPATGNAPETTISDTNYTGSITWAPAIAAGGKFTANTKYTANVKLTATGGYKFASDVKPIVAGATISGESVTDEGKTLTFKATFPETGNRTLKDIDIITKPELKLAVPTAAPNATATNERSLAVTGVYDDGSGGPVTVNWKIMTTPEPKGVYLDGSTLKVTNEAKAGTFMIEATSAEGYTDTEQVTITKETPKETAIVATAPATGTNITIPNGGTATSGQCSYKVYDQYGAEMTGTSATWTMEPATVTGVTVTTDGAIAVENTAETCTVKLYATSGALKSNEITFNIDRATSVATSLTIEGSADSVTVPTVTEPGTTKCEYAAYTAKVKDQYGQVMTGETITWNVTGNPGVTINNGQLTVTNKATGDTVTITAKSGALEDTKTVTINKDTAKETFVKITAQDNEPPVTIITCTGSQRLEYYTATAYDQYGNEKQDNVTWSLNSAPSGVTYEVSTANGNIVTLKVAPDTTAGTFKLVATSKTITTVKGELEIKVQKKTDVSTKINFNNGSLTYNGEGQEYKTAALDSSVTAGENSKWTYTYTVKGGTASLDGGLPKTVGTYNVTATYEDSLNVGSKTVELTIGPKVLHSSNLEQFGGSATKVYDGNANSNITVRVREGVLFGSDTLDIDGSAVYNSADVADANQITFTPNAITTGNYTLAASEKLIITDAKITARDLTIKPDVDQSKKFGEEDPTMLSFMTNGAVSGQTPSFTGKLSRAEGKAVGQYDITLGTLAMTDDDSYSFKTSNYTLKMVSPAVKFEITKADAPKLKEITVSQKYTVTAGEKAIGAAGMPADAGTLTYTKGTESKTGSVTVTDWKVDPTGKVTYTLSGGAAGDTVTLPVIIKSTNYADATVNVKITLTKPSYSGGGGSYTPSYTVSVDKTENGTITISPKSASKGDTVTITVKPDKGYELDTLKVLDKDGDKVKLTEKNGKYTFKMPSGKVTVKGSFVEEAPVQIFKDVPTDAYYYEAVKWAAEKGITGGVGNGLFAPNQPCTRAQIVTFLWRAAGSPAPKSMSSFADVPADAFYAKAVAWAVENGITGGTGDGKFSPDATCTRAQSVTFLYRAAGSPKVSSSAEFGDVATNAYYADAVAWAAKNGITGGIGDGLFGSNNDCTRAQIVTFLYRCVK